MNKRIMALLLALLMAAPAVVGCAEKKDEESAGTGKQNEEVSTSVDEMENLSEMEKRRLTKDNLPEADYDGQNFRISTRQGYLYEIWIEEADGEILNDALYNRNLAVEERFDVTIEPLYPNNDADHINQVKKTILSSDDAYDLVSSMVYQTGTIITEGCYLNWMNMEHTDLSKPWWINGVNDKFSVQGAIYTAVGDMCVSTLKLTYGIFYNRTKGENYSINETIYQDIRDGKWTIEYFNALVKDVYLDENGSSKADDADFFGFVAEPATNLDVYPFAFDMPIISQNADGIPEIVFNTEKTITAVELVNRLYWEGVGTYIPTNYNLPITMFRNGQALFTTTWMGNAFGTFREMEDDYSILPYPKFDESQEIYRTGAMDNYSVLGVPITTQDTAFVSLITEALNIESYRTLFPTYYEQALQNKYSRDEESIEMIDTLMKGRNFDFTTLFASSIPGLPWMFRELVAAKSNNFASKYKGYERGASKQLEKIIDAYEKNAAQ